MALRQDFGEGLEQCGAIGAFQRIGMNDRRFQHAGPGLGVQPFKRHPHLLAEIEQRFMEFGLHRGSQQRVSEKARRDVLQVAKVFSRTECGVSSNRKNSYSQADWAL